MTTRVAPVPLTLVEASGPACCPDGLGAEIAPEAAEELARLLKAVADPARLRLLAIIKSRGESCVCDLADLVGLSQPTVSHHLKVLVDAGILEREKRGTWAWYAIVPERLRELAAVLA